MKRGILSILLVLLMAGCAAQSGPSPGAGRPEARRPVRAADPARPAQAPIMRPVRNHQSDSIPEAFPALEPPVVDEAIYGSRMPQRVVRARLPDSPAPAEPEPRSARAEPREAPVLASSGPDAGE
ncbi:MAG TPA: hypothetical protein VD970_15590 [Acetobacteraceae bacterium]|nr:hypothetical protein [Acetobacteraceae bacterium]